MWSGTGKNKSSLKSNLKPRCNVTVQRVATINFNSLFKRLLKKQGFKPLEEVFNDIEDVRSHEQEKPQKVYVQGGDAVVANRLVLLGTGEVAICAALKIIDPTSDNQAYLLHAYPDVTSVDKIKKSLDKATSLGMNFKDSEIDIMPGSSYHDSNDPSSHILEALYKINPHFIDKISFIRDLSSSCQGLAVYNGQTYLFPPSLSIGTNYNYYSCKFSKHGIECVLKV